MAVTNNFSASTLDLNGVVSLSQPTALVWGPDGRLYVTEVDGDVKVLTIAFGDKNPGDADSTAKFYVAAATTLAGVKAIPNHNDNGALGGSSQRQVTGIDVTPQYDVQGNQVFIGGKPAVTVYVTSSDSRIGAGGGGNDAGLDTNSGVITKLVQTGPNAWDATDIVRGLPRSEENHATNGLEVIQEFDAAGVLVSERLIVAQGGNANAGAPSNNFAGQQEQPLSGAILEIDLDAIADMAVKTDAAGRKYVYDLPTLDDPTRAGTTDGADPFGGNDGLNSAKLLAGGPVQIYSPGYRNAYDVEVTEDGRVWTYDNGANNSWGGRPIGEAGSNGTIDFQQALGYIATNLMNGDGNTSDDINLPAAWNPSNKDNFHEVTRSDDLDGRELSAGQGGAQTYTVDGLTYVYGGHPNPTRASGALAGLLFSPGAGTDNAVLLLSSGDSYDAGMSDYAQVVAWLAELEDDQNLAAGTLTGKVVAVAPGVAYDIYLQDGAARVVAQGAASPGGTKIGTAGLPADIAEIVAARNPIEGDYKEAGQTDGALDTGNGSINGLAEYTSTVLDSGNVKMSGAIIAANLNGGSLIVMGRGADGVMDTATNGGFTVAAERTTINAGGGPLGLATLGDDYLDRGLSKPFQGSIWAATYNQNGPLIEIFQPANGAVPLAGAEITSATDHDLDGVDHLADPFEFSTENGYALGAGEKLVIDFNPQNTNFPTSLAGTGLLGAALDGATPNQDAQTAAENYSADQQQPGLYDIGGNVLPGGNAPILQIKKVAAGTVVGTANTARDVLHTGIRPDGDVERLVVTMDAKNWIPTAGGVKAGQLTGMIFGDGTQENFLRLVFGAVNGQPGFEVGYETGDANYQALAKVAVPDLANAAVAGVTLRLEIDINDGFAVKAAYQLEGQATFTELPLGGFVLPAGVLRDVLTGDHTVGTGAAEQASGAAVGFLAETSAGNPLEAIDFNGLTIEAFGNEIAATTGAAVGQPGSAAIDTVVYTGADTTLAPLAANVENFDGSGSAAAYTVIGNALGNVIRVGAGQNTVTTGAGADSVRGTLDALGGDEITDFGGDDEVIVEGATLSNFNVSYGPGGLVTINGKTLDFSGPDFADFDPADGASVFTFVQTADGVRITTQPALAPVVAISSGSADLPGAVLRGQVVDFLSDVGTGGAAGYVTGVPSKTYTNAVIAGTDIPGTVLDVLHQTERTAADTGKWGYAIPVENGDYLVDLIFAEIYHGVANAASNAVAGKRVFDIFVENGLVENDFDVIAAAGGAPKEVIKSYTAHVADGVLNIEFDASVDQAKISGLVVWKTGGGAGAPGDATAPVVAEISLDNPSNVQDGPRTATVVLTDETGFEAGDFAGLDGSELVFSGIEPAEISVPALAISADGKTATLSYTLTAPGGAWPSGSGTIAVAAGTFTDAAGNGSAAASAGFVLEPNLANLVRGDVVRAINVGTTNTGTATLGVDQVDGSQNNNVYGGAIAADTLIRDAAGQPIAFEADKNGYYTGSKSDASLNNNVDGAIGTTGSNAGGVDLDGSAYHTYRDSAVDTWTATYDGFANGTYVVELHFAELYHNAAGQRVGDFYIQGELVLDNFDVFAAAGGADKPTFRRHNVTVTDGTITVAVDSSVGQAGYSAIVVYDAVPGDLPPTVSVGDVAVIEGRAAEVVFTRTGDLSKAVTVDFTLTSGSADADDYAAPATGRVVIPAGAASAAVTIPITDDTRSEGAESFTLVVTGVANASGNAMVGDGAATVTIAPSDAAPMPAGTVLYRVNVGGPAVAASDGGPNWSADTGQFGAPGNSPYLASNSGGNSLYAAGSASAHAGPVDLSDGSIPATTPSAIFETERFDAAGGSDMTWRFPAPTGTRVEIRLYFAELFSGVDQPGERVFDVAVEGAVPASFDDIDPIALAGAKGAFVRSTVVTVGEDGILDLQLIHGIENPALKGIEILSAAAVDLPPSVAAGIADQRVTEGSAFAFAVPANAFADDGGAENLTLTAVLANGDPLPAWLLFDGETFSGTPPLSASGRIEVKLLASDGASSSASDVFTIVVGDRIWGGQGPNRLNGGEGDDWIWGQAGDDLISGRLGDDRLNGGSGNDRIWGQEGDDLIWGGDGHDLLRGSSGRDLIRGGAGADEIWGDKDDDEIWGGEGLDVIRAGLGNDRIDGGDNSDQIWADAGDDQIIGGKGYDTLFGGSGRDRLDGGLGADRLEGGSGADIFVFRPGETGTGAWRDVIVDFESGLDRIDLSAYEGLGFIGTAAFSGAGRELRLQDGSLVGDLDGDGQADFVIELQGGAGIAAPDLLLAATSPVLSGPSMASLAENTTEVARFTASDADGDALSFGLAGPDAALFEIDASGVLSLKAAPDFEAPADVDGDNVYDVTVTLSDGIETVSRMIAVSVTDAAESGPAPDPFAPKGDLDGDGTANAADADIDGDDLTNAADPFYYDSLVDGHGTTLADGATLRLDFDQAGTPFENGFTGVMPGTSTAPGYTKETGVGVVKGGQLVVPTTSGDTGGANNPQDDYYFGVKRGGGFTVETVIDNPFATAPKTSWQQLGLAISLDSTDFVKFVAGNVGGDLEFSYRNNDAETKVTATLPAGYTLFGAGSIAKLKLVIDIDVAAGGNVTATAKATILDASGQPVPGAAVVAPAPLALAGDLEAALADPNTAVGVGVTHTHGAAAQFEARFDYLEVKADNGTVAPEPTPATAAEVFAAIGAETPDAPASGAIGAAVLKVTAESGNVQISNYGANSFTLENTGTKKIAAVFIDVTDALYGDAVFDDDGSGGDSTVKPWNFDSGQAAAGGLDPTTTGAADYQEFWLPAQDAANLDPLFNTVGDGGKGADGGWRGAVLKFSASANGGFQPGETVGFSGDMDPNSIAGYLKSTVDAGTLPSGWDVGGISGAELIGSRITVLFTDGTSATGQLASDKSQAGAQALITQAPAAGAATLSVNGVSEGGAGSYGGTAPEVIVGGPAGATIRVTMTKGIQPVQTGTANAEAIVEARLADEPFKANNAVEFQTVDVVLGPNETSRDISGLFTYSNAPNGYAFAGSDKLPLGFVASVIDPATGLATGPVTAPLYLANNGAAVAGGGGQTGYWLEEGGRVKVQFEDIAGGADAPAGWVFQDADNGNNPGFQGEGYYYWKNQTGLGVDGNPNAGLITATVHIEEAGTYSLRVRSARDTNDPTDQRNDIWVKVDDDVQDVLPAGTTPLVTSGGFAKLFGAGTSWGFAQGFDSASETVSNPPAQVVLSEGFHTITFAGRSQGFHVDFFELYKDQNPSQNGIQAPAVGAANSPYIEGFDQPDTGGEPESNPGSGTQTAASVASSSDDFEQVGGAGSSDLEFGLQSGKPNAVGLRFTGLELAETATIESAYFVFQAEASNGAAASFAIQIEDTVSAATFGSADDLNGRTYLAEAVVWNSVEAWQQNNTYRSPDIAALIEAVIDEGGLDALDALAFRVTGTGLRQAHSFEGSGAAPQLVITYEDLG